VGALLKPDKAPLRNVGIITLILVEARTVSLYGLYGKSQAHRATQARRVIGRVGVKVQERCIPITYKRLREEGQNVQKGPFAIGFVPPSLHHVTPKMVSVWCRP
jgi:hypothetical protein